MRALLVALAIAALASGVVPAADKILRLEAAPVEKARVVVAGADLEIHLDREASERVRIRFALPPGASAKEQPGGRIAILDRSGREIRALERPRVTDAEGRTAGARWLAVPVLAERDTALVLEVDAAGMRSPLVVAEIPVQAPRVDPTASGPLVPPSNDTCGGAIGVPPAGPFPWTSAVRDVLDATTDGDPAPSCQELFSRGTWYRFTPAETTDYTLSLCSSGPTSTTVEDTVLAVFTSSTGQCSGAMTEVDGYCDDDSCGEGDFQSSLERVRLAAGTPYFILAYVYDTEPPAPGSASMQLRVEKFAPPPPPPANDACSGAAVVPGNGPFPFATTLVPDVSGATTEGDPRPACRSGTSRGVWYAFTPGETATYRIATCAEEPAGTTLADTVLGIYTSADGTCAGPFTPVRDGCSDDGCGVEPGQALIDAVLLQGGTTYYVLAYKGGPSAPATGETAVQLVFDRNPEGPSNDFCAGAEEIPSTGPFPWFTGVTDVADANRALDPPKPSCQGRVGRSVWYRFTPQSSGPYRFSTCADAGTETTADDTVLAVYTSSDATCDGSLTQIAGACDDDGCRGEANQSVLESVELEAGEPAYVLVHLFGTAPPATGQSLVQLRVEPDVAAANDGCAGAAPLALDEARTGSTRRAANDFQIADTACFTAQSIATEAAGGDVVFSFDAPATARYSFRASGFPSTGDPVVTVARECPASGAPANIGQCLRAANRNAAFGAESAECVSLQAGERVFVFVDEATPTIGSAFAIEASRCDVEVEPNDGPAQARPWACGATGAIDTAGDIDFLGLGARAIGERIFAVVDGLPASGQDFDLRVTTETDTLEYDDANNDPPLGSLSANVAGAGARDGAHFLRVSYYDPMRAASPYRVLATIRPPESAAEAEIEPNDALAEAAPSASGYVWGSLAGETDVDHHAFEANAGDLLFIALDLDPRRGDGPFNGALALLDPGGTEVALANDLESASSIASGAGRLDATTPNAPAEAIVHRATRAGTYVARVSWSSGLPGDYLLSMAVACPASDSDGDGLADLRDCAPADLGARAFPLEVERLDLLADTTTLSWTTLAPVAGSGTVYDVVRGDVEALGGGPGEAETCLAAGVATTTTVDASRPALGSARWYLVRGRNACGTGGYGTASDGASRAVTACP